jgi:hypothetical protein
MLAIGAIVDFASPARIPAAIPAIEAWSHVRAVTPARRSLPVPPLIFKPDPRQDEQEPGPPGDDQRPICHYRNPTPCVSAALYRITPAERSLRQPAPGTGKFARGSGSPSSPERPYDATAGKPWGLPAVYRSSSN